MTPVAVGALAGLALAWCTSGAGASRLAAVVAGTHRARPTSDGELAGLVGGSPATSVGGSPRGRSRRGSGSDADSRARLAALLVEVAALLRAGTPPPDAWRRVLGVPVPDRVPRAADLLAAIGGASGHVSGGASGRVSVSASGGAVGGRRSGRWISGHWMSGGWLSGRRWRASGGSGPPVGAVVAAARVADELGAPLAGVLEQVARAIAAQAEAEADVAAALAAPRSSARVLAWLPVAGLLLGTALGADPVGVLAGGGLGTASGVAGFVLLLVGRRWTAALLRRAERAGEAR